MDIDSNLLIMQNMLMIFEDGIYTQTEYSFGSISRFDFYGYHLPYYVHTRLGILWLYEEKRYDNAHAFNCRSNGGGVFESIKSYFYIRYVSSLILTSKVKIALNGRYSIQ